MKKWFNSLPRLVQIILLFIPVCNWIMELGIRWSHFAERKGLLSLILAILESKFHLIQVQKYRQYSIYPKFFSVKFRYNQIYMEF